MTEPPSGGYSVVRRLVRGLLGLFYSSVDVVGREHVPPTGPLIVAANHHNSIVDAMLLMATFDRPLRVLANAPLFRHPLIGPFLRLMGGLPVNRRQEAGDDPEKNKALFAATTEALGRGDAIALFPEGRTQPEPTLLPVKTGAARMLLAAESANPDGPRVTLLPVGLVFDQPGTFRDGSAFVWIGAPVPTGGLDEPGADPLVPARRLTDRLRDALRGQIVEADDRATLRLLKLAEEIWRGADAAPAGEAERAEWLQAAMRAYRGLARTDPARVDAFRFALEAYDREAEKSGLDADLLSRRYSTGGVLRFAAVEGLSLFVATPFAIAGLLLHGVPYRLTEFAVRRIPHTDEEEATDKIAAGLVMYPLCWIAEGVAAYALGRSLGLALLLVALPVTAFFALTGLERLRRAVREARAFTRFLFDRDALRRLRRSREALGRQLRELAELDGARRGAAG